MGFLLCGKSELSDSCKGLGAGAELRGPDLALGMEKHIYKKEKGGERECRLCWKVLGTTA